MKIRKNSKIKIILYVILAIILITMGTAYSVLRQKLDVIGKVSINPAQSNNGYIVTYEIKNKWYANNKYYYQIIMKLTNNTDSLLDGWNITIDTPSNAEIVTYSSVNCKIKGKRIEFTNVSYNAQVPSKQSTSFEFQVSTTDAYFSPGNITINGSGQEGGETPTPPEEKQITIELVKDNSWESNGYNIQYTINITNTGKTEINSWQFDLSAKKAYTIEQIWNAQFTQKSSTLNTITNSDYNGIIQPDGKISFGFIMKTSIKNNPLEEINVILK